MCPETLAYTSVIFIIKLQRKYFKIKNTFNLDYIGMIYDSPRFYKSADGFANMANV